MKHKRRLPRINGRRGAFQLLFGVVFGCLTAATYIALDFPPALAWIDVAAARFGLDVNPSIMALVWGPPTVAALMGAFLPRPKDWFSFAALTFAPVAFGCLYLIGGIVSPVGTSLYGAILYWAMAGAVMVVSGMTGDKDRDDREVPHD